MKALEKWCQPAITTAGKIRADEDRKVSLMTKHAANAWQQERLHFSITRVLLIILNSLTSATARRSVVGVGEFLGCLMMRVSPLEICRSALWSAIELAKLCGALMCRQLCPALQVPTLYSIPSSVRKSLSLKIEHDATTS